MPITAVTEEQHEEFLPHCGELTFEIEAIANHLGKRGNACVRRGMLIFCVGGGLSAFGQQTMATLS